MNRTANKEVVEKCLNYMDGLQQYSVEGFLRERNLWINAEEKSGRMIVTCPLHNDDKPSMLVDNEGGWHCFSCGRGGKFMHLYMFYSDLVKNTKVGFYQLLDQFLKQDSRMRLAVGYNSVYRIEEQKFDINNFKRIKFDGKKELEVNNLIQLYNRMHKEGLDKNIADIKLAILHMQDGYAPRDIYKILKGGSASTPSASILDEYKDLDISDILSGFSMGGGN